MSIHDDIAALPEWPEPPQRVTTDNAINYFDGKASAAIARLTAEVERLRNGLKNCMLLAARHRKEIGDWQHIIRFCIEAGVQMSPLRETDAVLAEPTKEQP